jgi:hypothetical protein
MPGQLKCLSCGATFPDTTAPGNVAYFHVCPDKIVDQPEQVDKDGNVTKPATFKATPNPRNENLQRNPDNPQEHVIISKGAGVEAV